MVYIFTQMQPNSVSINVLNQALQVYLYVHSISSNRCIHTISFTPFYGAAPTVLSYQLHIVQKTMYR